MADFVVLEDFEAGLIKLSAGTIIDDNRHDLTALRRAGLIATPFIQALMGDAVTAYLQQRDNRKTQFRQQGLVIGNVLVSDGGASTVGASTGVSVQTVLDQLTAGSGYTMFWGARMNVPSVGQFLEVCGTANASSRATLDQRSEASAPKAGTMRQLAYNTLAADATTMMKVLVNSLVAATIPLTGVSGVEPVSVALVPGDLVAFEYDAGAAPDEGNYIAFVEPP